MAKLIQSDYIAGDFNMSHRYLHQSYELVKKNRIFL